MATLALFGFVPAAAAAALNARLAPLDVGCLVAGHLAVLAGPPLASDVETPAARARLLQVHRHHQVLEIAATQAPILPCRIDSFVDDLPAVARLLDRHETPLLAALEASRDLVQISVMVRWDVADVLRRLRDLGRLDGLTGQRSEEIAQAVAGCLDEERHRLQAVLRPRLAAVAREVAMYERVEPEIVLEIGLLLERSAEAALDAAIEALDEELGGTLTFRCVGPLPPVDFAAVHIERIGAEVVDAARATLGVDGADSREDLTRAYRIQVRRIHPDSFDAEVGGAASIGAIQDAYRLLLRLADARESLRDGRVGADPDYLLDVPARVRRAA